MNDSSSLFIIGTTVVTREAFVALVKQYDALFAEHSHILIRCQDPLLFNVALIASWHHKNHLFICPSYYSDEEVEALCKKFHNTLFLFEHEGYFGTKVFSHTICTKDTGALYIFTSATTGPAKITQHSWETIQHSAKQAKKLEGNSWLMSYAIYTYAGLQVFFSAYLNNGSIYYPGNDQEMAAGIVRNKISVISATPTYWKMLVSSWSKTVVPPVLEQATLGGEIVNQDVLDLVQQFFKPKRLTHIYASSEAGTTIVVSDGLAGFPLAFLEKRGGVGLRLEDRCLKVKSPYGMLSYLNAPEKRTADGWIDTGDLVEIKGERIYFLGRQDEVINVGGLKVHPEEIETILCALDSIFDACVYAKKSPITGSIVAADVVMKKGCSFDSDFLYKQLRGLLPDFKIPRFIQQVSNVEVSANGKKIRPK